MTSAPQPTTLFASRPVPSGRPRGFCVPVVRELPSAPAEPAWSASVW
jgi:hypothetical protein